MLRPINISVNHEYRTRYVLKHGIKPRAFNDYELSRFYMQTGVRFQTMTGKLEFVPSISTAAAKNPICCKRAKDPRSICHACYALSLAAGRKGLAGILERNYNILTTEVIPVDVWPVIHADKCRIESFGDLANIVQAINYIHLLLKNKQAGNNCKFAWWTKNPAFIDMAMQKLGVTKKDLSNCQFVLSADRMNADDNYMIKTLQRFPWIDRVFTVYTADHALENSVDINCGEKHCNDCGLCYTADGPRHIREILKQEARTYYAGKYGLYTTIDAAAAAVKASAGIPKTRTHKAISAARDAGDVWAELKTAAGRVIITLNKYGYGVAYAG